MIPVNFQTKYAGSYTEKTDPIVDNDRLLLIDSEDQETNGNDKIKTVKFTKIPRLNASGNLGINTSPTTGKLQVNSGAASNNIITLQASGLTSRTYGLGLNSNSSFAIYDNTAATTRLVVTSDGYLGIGTTTPTSKLSVVGLPTSSAGLATGDIWIDAGAGNVLKIV